MLGGADGFSNLSQANIVVWDCKVTNDDELCEWGAVTVSRDGLYEISKESMLIKSSTPNPKKSSTTDKLTNTMLQNPTLPSFEQVASRIFETLNNKIWVGHKVTTYQRRVLLQAFNRIGRQCPVSTVMIDTKILIENTLPQDKKFANFELETLADFYGLRHANANSSDRSHGNMNSPGRALHDAQLVWEVFRSYSLAKMIDRCLSGMENSKPHAPPQNPGHYGHHGRNNMYHNQHYGAPMMMAGHHNFGFGAPGGPRQGGPPPPGPNYMGGPPGPEHGGPGGGFMMQHHFNAPPIIDNMQQPHDGLKNAPEDRMLHGGTSHTPTKPLSGGNGDRHTPQPEGNSGAKKPTTPKRTVSPKFATIAKPEAAQPKVEKAAESSTPLDDPMSEEDLPTPAPPVVSSPKETASQVTKKVTIPQQRPLIAKAPPLNNGLNFAPAVGTMTTAPTVQSPEEKTNNVNRLNSPPKATASSSAAPPSQPVPRAKPGAKMSFASIAARMKQNEAQKTGNLIATSKPLPSSRPAAAKPNKIDMPNGDGTAGAPNSNEVYTAGSGDGPAKRQGASNMVSPTNRIADSAGPRKTGSPKHSSPTKKTEQIASAPAAVQVNAGRPTPSSASPPAGTGDDGWVVAGANKIMKKNQRNMRRTKEWKPPRGGGRGGRRRNF